MTTSATIRSGDAVIPGAATQIPCFVDVCSGGTVGSFYGPFVPGAPVSDQLGGGPGPDQLLAFLAQPGAQAAYFVPAAPTWASAPSVVHVGTGPSVTTANAAGASGPYDSHTRVYTMLSGGANGQAMTSVSYDGGPAVETMPVPAATSGYLAGSAPITATVLATVEALTLVFASPSAQTLTFPAGSLVAAAAGLLAATATVASPVTVLAAGLITGGKTALLANGRRLRFTTAGSPASDAPATVAITGSLAGVPVTETLSLAQTAASVSSVGVYDTIVSLVYAAADGTGATVAIGYEAAYATATELVAEAQTLATAAPLAVTTSDAQTSAGHFLAFTTTSTGASATVAFNASPGTGATLLGFTTAETNTGAVGAYSPAWTGATDTFPTGTYVKGDTYTMAATGPTASTSAVVNALAVCRANYLAFPFGGVFVTAPPSSAANAASLQAACSSTVAPWRTDNSLPVPIVTGTAFHVASATSAANQANITTMDAATAAAFTSNPAALDLVCVGDIYVTGSRNLRPGSFRRSAVWAAAVQRATLTKLGASIAEGVIPGCSMRGPDGLTLTRDEATAVVKLGPSTGGNTGPGFSVIKSTPQGLGFPKFPAGVTRAGTTSQLRSDNAVFTACRVQVIAFSKAIRWEGETWPTSPIATDTGPAGQATDGVVKSKSDDVYALLDTELFPKGKDPSASFLSVAIDNSGVFAGTGLAPLVVKFIPLFPVRDVTIDIAAISVATTAAAGTTITG